YEYPRTRMVADFIGQTNLLPAVVNRPGEVSLIDGQRIYADAQAPPGSEVTLTLRPEKVRLAPADHEGPCRAVNALIGWVQRRVYMGSTLSYEVELGEVKLRVRHENAPGVPTFAAGDEVCVEFAPESCTPLDD
ncbi:MAG: TOBE domain-containing protein, partial [Nitriliruptorales bacterium]|nr:TOBE domain-containing protein [Nitriliruptorales bacterium]